MQKSFDIYNGKFHSNEMIEFSLVELNMNEHKSIKVQSY